MQDWNPFFLITLYLPVWVISLYFLQCLCLLEVHPEPQVKRSKSVSPLASTSTGSASGVQAKSSDKLNTKTIDPFAKPQRSPFASAAIYSKGGIPCRLVCCSMKHKIQWECPPETIPYDRCSSTLPRVFEGTNTLTHLFLKRDLRSY